MAHHTAAEMRFFFGNSHQELGEKIAEHLRIKPGRISYNSFSCGELYAKIDESIRGYDVFILQTCSTYLLNKDLMELFIIIDSCKRASAATINIVMPYYGYARQDKKSAPREPISARLIANLLETAGIDRIITLDLHADQIQGYFDVPVDHLTALPLFVEYFKKLDLPNPTVVAPDIGRSKAVKKLADRIGAEIAILHKTRPEHNVSEIMNIVGEVNGRTAILFDDIVDTGGSVCNAAEALHKAGANKDIYLAATHAVFSGPAYERLQKSKFTDIVITDSIPVPKDKQTPNMTILSTAPLLGEAILRNHYNLSISEIFDDDHIPIKRALEAEKMKRLI